jgi:hypothetical protein
MTDNSSSDEETILVAYDTDDEPFVVPILVDDDDTDDEPFAPILVDDDTDDEPFSIGDNKPIVVGVVEGPGSADVANAFADTLAEGVSEAGPAAVVKEVNKVELSSSSNDKRRATGGRRKGKGKKRRVVEEWDATPPSGFTPIPESNADFVSNSDVAMVANLTPRPPPLPSIGRSIAGVIGFMDSTMDTNRYVVKRWPDVITASGDGKVKTVGRRAITESRSFNFRFDSDAVTYYQQRDMFERKGGAALVYEIRPAKSDYHGTLHEDENFPRLLVKAFEGRKMEALETRDKLAIKKAEALIKLDESKAVHLTYPNDLRAQSIYRQDIANNKELDERIEQADRTVSSLKINEHKEMRMLHAYRERIEGVMVPAVAIYVRHPHKTKETQPVILMQRGIPLDEYINDSAPIQGMAIEMFPRHNEMVNHVTSMQQELLKNGMFYADIKPQNCIVLPSSEGIEAKIVFGDYGGLAMISPEPGNSSDNEADRHSVATFPLPECNFKGRVSLRMACAKLSLDVNNKKHRTIAAKMMIMYHSACLFVSIAYGDVAHQLRYYNGRHRTYEEWAAVVAKVQARLIVDFEAMQRAIPKKVFMLKHFAKCLDIDPRNRPGWSPP